MVWYRCNTRYHLGRGSAQWQHSLYPAVQKVAGKNLPQSRRFREEEPTAAEKAILPRTIATLNAA